MKPPLSSGGLHLEDAPLVALGRAGDLFHLKALVKEVLKEALEKPCHRFADRLVAGSDRLNENRTFNVQLKGIDIKLKEVNEP